MHEPIMQRLDKIEAIQQTDRSESKAEYNALMQELESVLIRLDALSTNQANLLDAMAGQKEMLQNAVETVRHSSSRTEPNPPAPSMFPPDLSYPDFQPSESFDQESDYSSPSSTQQPEAVYQTAYNDYLNRNYDLAILAFKNFLNSYPASNLAVNAQYWIGECYYAQKEYDKALIEFEKVLTRYPEAPKAVSALLKKGLTLFEQGNIQQGRSILEGLIDKHPYSSEARIAEDRLR